VLFGGDLPPHPAARKELAVRPVQLATRILLASKRLPRPTASSTSATSAAAHGSRRPAHASGARKTTAAKPAAPTPRRTRRRLRLRNRASGRPVRTNSKASATGRNGRAAFWSRRARMTRGARGTDRPPRLQTPAAAVCSGRAEAGSDGVFRWATSGTAVQPERIGAGASRSGSAPIHPRYARPPPDQASPGFADAWRLFRHQRSASALMGRTSEGQPPRRRGLARKGRCRPRKAAIPRAPQRRSAARADRATPACRPSWSKCRVSASPRRSRRRGRAPRSMSANSAASQGFVRPDHANGAAKRRRRRSRRLRPERASSSRVRVPGSSPCEHRAGWAAPRARRPPGTSPRWRRPTAKRAVATTTA
jgi:hypothetical protein